MKRLMIAVFAVSMLAGCSSMKGMTPEQKVQKIEQDVVKVAGDIHKVVVTGCKDLPKIEVALATVQEFLPPDATVESIKAGVIVGETVANKICAKILAAEAAKAASIK